MAQPPQNSNSQSLQTGTKLMSSVETCEPEEPSSSFSLSSSLSSSSCPCSCAAHLPATTTTTEPQPLYVGGPLLGRSELIKSLPGKKEPSVKLQITTWNMGSLPFPSDNQLGSLFREEGVDVHVLAIQESWPSPEESELLFQMTLGAAYVLFHSINFGTLHLCIFLRRELVWFTTEPVEVTHTVRSGRLFKTKGAVGIGFGLFGTRILVINAHLSAGEEGSRDCQRMEELNKILLAHEIKRAGYDTVYLFGDLNFRISSLSRESIMKELRVNNVSKILMEDQLNKLLINNTTSSSSSSLPESLKGFREADTITFRPTYKYDLSSDNFDSSAKKRAPAYTDRIMFKTFSNRKERKDDAGPLCTCLKYESVPDLRVSDHRPVIGVFSLKLKPGFDTLPITGGKFKRDLYVKAMQKRAKFLLDHRKQLASAACRIA